MRVTSSRGAALMVVALICASPLVPPPARADVAAEAAALREGYRRPPGLTPENPALAELGGRLFWDKRVSASGQTACASCHYPHLAWADTAPRSRNDSGKPTSRKSQPLIGLGHADGALVGWDGKAATLEAQATASIATGSMSMRETDNPVKVEVIVQRIRDIPDYATRFAAALPGAPITIDTIVQAIAAYERTIEPGIAPFDRWVEGDEAAISDAAKRGFVLFNGKAGCAACHGGWRFTDDQFHDIGTTTTDLGRGREVKNDEAMQYAFKTPTLRSVATRAPYMHNASAATLRDVVLHYENGGIDRPSRSPAIAPFTLEEQERLDLVAFMETLTGKDDGAAARRLAGVD